MNLVLLFVRSDHWFSRLMCWLTGARWSHVAIGVRGHNEVDWFRMNANGTAAVPTHVIDSREGVGVTIPRTLESFLAAYPDREAWELPLPMHSNAALWLLGQIGKPYDKWGRLGFLMPWRYWQDSNAWWCFELAAQVLFYGGAPFVGPLADNNGGVGARAFYKYVQQFGRPYHWGL